MENSNLKYFLAANSCVGFEPHFDTCYDAELGWRAYIIKGGPGTGKSSFMKYIVKRANEQGKRVELMPCSSDPHSLDGVILPDSKIVIMDGTSPHTVDPKYPGVCEQILNFGEFWKKDKFAESEKRIIALTNKNKEAHKRAARYLKAAGEFLTDSFKIADACTDKERINAYAKKLCKKYIPFKNDKKGKEWVRFLSGITPVGVVSYTDTILNQCSKRVIIADEYGSVADRLIRQIRECVLLSGYEIITIKNAFLPNLIIDGIIIPELNLCFIRECENFILEIPDRRIHSRRFVNTEQISKSRKRLKFNNKTASRLLSYAAEILSEAKLIHDELEKEYISAMDFKKLNKFAEKIASEILGI